MGEIKPLGSEKLSGNEKLDRILELTYYKNTINENKSKNKFELIVEGKISVFGIQKEKDGYYVKKGINESSLDYIGGLYMKNKNRFSSYNEAYKRLEFLKGQEELNEATKYVLKNKLSSTENVPSMTDEQLPPVPQEQLPPSPEGDMAPEGELPPSPESDMSPEGDLSTGVEGEDEETGDTLKDIQKYTGKLTQKMREYGDELESDDIKYVLNMVLSAFELDKLEDEDKEEILDKLDGEDDIDGEMVSAEELPKPENDETPEDELGETYASLEELTNSDFDFEDEEDEMVDISNEFDDEISQEGTYYDNDSDFDMQEESGQDQIIPFKELIQIAMKAGNYVLDAKDSIIELGVTSLNDEGVFLSELEEVLHEYDLDLDELLSDEDDQSYDVNFDNGNEDDEPESLDEYFDDDDDYIDPSENPNYYDIDGDDSEFDDNLNYGSLDSFIDDSSIYREEFDEEEDYGTTKRKSRRPKYDDYSQLNEIRDIINKYRIN